MADEDIAYYEAMMAEQEAFEHEAEMEALRELENVENIPPKANVPNKPPESKIPEVPPSEPIPTDLGFEPITPFADESEPTTIPDTNAEIGQKRKPDSLKENNPPKRPRPAKTIVLRNPPVECDSLKLVSEDGTIRYLRKKTTNIQCDTDNSIQMIGTSMRELRLQAYKEKEEVESRRMEALKLSQKKLKDPHSKNLDWISKYRAQKYTDLLSDETTNRAILKWLKMWQPCVFKVKRKVKKNQDEKLQESFGRKFGGPEKDNKPGQNNYKKKFKSAAQRLEENATLEDEEDTPYFRPKFRVLMLSGPPGLGKTTLAHVAASHSGIIIIDFFAE